MIKSTALEVNLARTQVDVDIDPKYSSLQDVMAEYYGLLNGLNTYLKEVSHPYRSWQFIVSGARSYALDHFHLMRSHPMGVEAAERLVDIFMEALTTSGSMTDRIDAADNVVLFLQKIITATGEDFHRFVPLLVSVFDRIGELPDDLFMLFVKSYYPLKRLSESLDNLDADPEADMPRLDGAMNRLLVRYLTAGYDYWLSQKKPTQWFVSEIDMEIPDMERLHAIFTPVKHDTLRAQRKKVARIAKADLSASDVRRKLCRLDDFGDIVQSYRRIPRQLLDAGGEEFGQRWKMLFLLHSMNIEGLALLHEDTLRDINRTLESLISSQSRRYSTTLIKDTFSILKTSSKIFPATALSCVLNMGKAVFRTDADDLLTTFIDAVIDLGFQAPEIKGVGNDWQIQVNSAHIQNIRTWLELIELRPKKTTRLMSNLIIHLAVGGVFIRDTDLFGRDITRLLNSDIGPIYNLTKQLARLFPVYFNDIGAEGELRDISTRIDELCHRRDPLIHFLRKQSHVESSNRILGLMEAALYYWASKDKTTLIPFLPPNIYDEVDPEGPYLNGVHRVVSTLSQSGLKINPGLLLKSETALKKAVDRVEGVSDKDRERFMLFSEFYKQLNNKYNLDFKNLRTYVDQLSSEAFPHLDQLKAALDEPVLKDRISGLLDYLEILRGIILRDETYEIREDIYKKRHFTVDIPSMYGSYHELKFDAMGLTLRIEAMVNVLFEELVGTIDLSFITKSTCHQIYARLMLFDRALKIDGINSAELERQLGLLRHSLEIRGFSFTQYLDIFKGFAQAARNVINDYFNNIHGEHLMRILDTVPQECFLEKFMPVGEEDREDHEKLCLRTSEIFFRDRLATSLGLQQMDLFLSRILNTLFHQSSKLPKEKLRLLLNYDPERAVTPLTLPNPLADDLINLGNKGYNLIKLIRYGLPVPPGFIITTEVYRCREIIETFPPANENFQDQVTQNIRMLEKITRKSFGKPENPLLISVRSGSSISQPGMMDTFLNVGMNEEIAEGLAAKSDNPWFAWDSYRRFLQCYGMGMGLSRDDFDDIIGDHKKHLGIPLKKEFSGEHMKQVAMNYKRRILDEGHDVPSDPMRQLYATIHNVMDSWESEKAQTYRRIMGISDDWGTAITVQAMVFGNHSRHAGAGVIFTHNPRWSSERLSLWGDFTLENQGEDVVAGLVKTLPISLRQQEIELRETDITLETHFPKIYLTMLSWAEELIYKRGWSPQELEFTFESPSVEDLYLLQTRDMAIRERKRVLTFDPEGKKRNTYLGHGVGVSAGAMSGRLVFDLDEVEYWRAKEPQTALILVRGDTVPDDIKEIFAADGVLTARGGVTSHAAVVAHRLGKTCVVGCSDMICDERERVIRFAQHELRSGDYISIDGREGSVYRGFLKLQEA